MALVSFLPPVRFDIPHEPGQWIEFRKPANRDVRKARQLAEREGRQGVRDLGAEFIKALREDDDAKADKAMKRAKQLEAEQEYAPAQFDRDTLLLASIADWS